MYLYYYSYPQMSIPFFILSELLGSQVPDRETYIPLSAKDILCIQLVHAPNMSPFVRGGYVNIIQQAVIIVNHSL